jgi:large subunit ribosomal protein L29e
MAKSKNHTNHN